MEWLKLCSFFRRYGIMSVSSRWYEPKQAWQVQWRSSGKKSLYVRVSASAGDKGAAERVASRLRARVENSTDKSDASLFWSVKAELIAEELAPLEPHYCRSGATSVPASPGSQVKRRCLSTKKRTAWKTICYRAVCGAWLGEGRRRCHI